MKTKTFTKTFTKTPMLRSSLYLKQRDVDLIHAAATRLDVSQSDFIREAVREKARRTLRGVEGADKVPAQQGVR